LSVLLQAIRAHDVKQVVRLFQYPFRLNAPGLPYPIPVSSPAELARMYDMVLNPVMRCAIETSHLPTPAAPHPAYKLAIAEGVVSLADGRVIAVRTSDGMKITRMTAAHGSKAPARPPQRLIASWRVQASGRLAYDDVDAYLMRLRAGAHLTITIEGFPGHSLLLRVREAATKALLRGGRNRIRKKRGPCAFLSQATTASKSSAIRPYCDPDLTYVLTSPFDREVIRSRQRYPTDRAPLYPAGRWAHLVGALRVQLHKH